jgi:transposase InsO family protein
MLELAWASPPPARRLAGVTHGCEARTVSVLKVLDVDVYLFDSLEQVREITEAWLETHSTERPHDRLGQVRP